MSRMGFWTIVWVYMSLREAHRQKKKKRSTFTSHCFYKYNIQRHFPVSCWNKISRDFTNMKDNVEDGRKSETEAFYNRLYTFFSKNKSVCRACKQLNYWDKICFQTWCSCTCTYYRRIEHYSLFIIIMLEL